MEKKKRHGTRKGKFLDKMNDSNRKRKFLDKRTNKGAS